MRAFKKERQWPSEENKTVEVSDQCPGKICRKCKKYSINFFKKNGNPDGYSFYCKKCDYEMTNAARYKSKYKISIEEVNSIKAAQNNACKICSRSLTMGNMVVDHCHKKLQFRGVLCRLCNSVLGYAKDRPDILRKAAIYLEESA